MEETIDLPAHENDEIQKINYVDITIDIVSAYLTHNHVSVSELPSLLTGVHAAFAGLDQRPEVPEPAVRRLTPAQIRRSITPDALISFIDGRSYKTLKRHLTGNGLTIEQYRERFGLPRDYPSTAPNFSAARADMARQSGLGRKKPSEEPALTNDA